MINSYGSNKKSKENSIQSLCGIHIKVGPYFQFSAHLSFQRASSTAVYLWKAAFTCGPPSACSERCRGWKQVPCSVRSLTVFPLHPVRSDSECKRPFLRAKAGKKDVMVKGFILEGREGKTQCFCPVHFCRNANRSNSAYFKIKTSHLHSVMVATSFLSAALALLSHHGRRGSINWGLSSCQKDKEIKCFWRIASDLRPTNVECASVTPQKCWFSAHLNAHLAEQWVTWVPGIATVFEAVCRQDLQTSR